MSRRPPISSSLSSNPRDRVYSGDDFIDWVREAKDAACLGADLFERHFDIDGQKMVCRVAFYWSGKADQEPRIARLECMPEHVDS